MDLIRQGNYLEAVELTQQLVESNKFTSMNEAILEVWLPVIREQTYYSDTVIERLSPRFASLEVSEFGLPVIADEEGSVLIEKTAPSTSNVEWAIPIVELAYGLEGEERNHTFRNFDISREGMSFDSRAELYTFLAVIDGLTQLEEPIELPNGIKVTTLANFYYYDVEGNLQKINAPFFSYDREALTMHLYSGDVPEYESLARFDELLNKALSWREQNKGPMTIEGRNSLENGKIVFLGFNMQSSPEFYLAGRDFFGEVIKLYHTQESLDAFAQDGDPKHLPQTKEGPLLLLHLEGTSSSLSDAFQEE
jgi:hypothetical protein